MLQSYLIDGQSLVKVYQDNKIADEFMLILYRYFID